jgi:hypothetical protein
MNQTRAPNYQDPAMWRKLLSSVQRNENGGLYEWVRGLHRYVAGDEPEDERSTTERRQPPQHHTDSERVPYKAAFEFGSFENLTRHCLLSAEKVSEPYASLLRKLEDCYPGAPNDHQLQRQQKQGATYRQLAYIGRLSGMDKRQRARWYRIAEGIPLSQRHAGHIIARMDGAQGDK